MIFILLPAFNEEQSLSELIPALHGVLKEFPEPGRILVVNDGSQDGTSKLITEYAGTMPVQELKHPTNLGYGAALHTGYRYVLAQDAPEDSVVVSLDADRTHGPEFVPRLIKKIRDGTDMVTASYVMEGGSYTGIPKQRAFLSYVVNYLFRITCPMPGAKTYSNGFRAYRLSILRKAQARFQDRLIEDSGFAGGTELFLKTAACGGRSAEVPFALHYERRGKGSKIHFLPTIYGYLKLIVKTNLYRCFLMAVLGLWTLSLPMPAKAAAGTEGATFLEIPVGAGPAALGSAYSALASDAYAPVWNPAGLGFVDSPQLATQYLSYLQSINDEFVSVAYPLEPGRTLGGSVQYLGTGDISGTEVGGAPSGSYSSYYAAYSLAYGQALSDRWSLGMTAKWINAQISNVSANAYAVDFGSLYRCRPDLTFAATLTNLGTSLHFLSEGDSLPLAFHAAAAYAPASHWLTALEAVVPQAGAASVRFGTQWRPVEAVSLRAGYRTDTLKELSPMAGFSAGLGITFWNQELAYAWVPLGDLGSTHYISLVLKFGAPLGKTNMVSPEPAEPVDVEPAAPPARRKDVPAPEPSLERGAPEAQPRLP